MFNEKGKKAQNVALIKELINQGYTPPEIAEKTGLKASSVRTYITEYNLKPKKRRDSSYCDRELWEQYLDVVNAYRKKKGLPLFKLPKSAGGEGNE